MAILKTVPIILLHLFICFVEKIYHLYKAASVVSCVKPKSQNIIPSQIYDVMQSDVALHTLIYIEAMLNRRCFNVVLINVETLYVVSTLCASWDCALAWVQCLFVCLFDWFGRNVTLSNLSVISRRCLDVRGLPHWNITPQTLWHDIPPSHIILTLNWLVLALLS